MGPLPDPEELAERFARPLPRAWYDRPADRIAEELIGAYLIVREGSGLRAGRLVETEAYLVEDPASHAFRGETPRNRSMFAGAGTLYVFRIHRVHCANAVARRGEAVLLRAAEPLTSAPGSLRGPGRLARELGITRADDGSDLSQGRVRLAPGARPAGTVRRGPRVGISRAKELALRFYLDGHPAVSYPRRPTRAGLT
jgi:DNA-3-methyladenine glycosylase